MFKQVQTNILLKFMICSHGMLKTLHNMNPTMDLDVSISHTNTYTWGWSTYLKTCCVRHLGTEHDKIFTIFAILSAGYFDGYIVIVFNNISANFYTYRKQGMRLNVILINCHFKVQGGAERMDILRTASIQVSVVGVRGIKSSFVH